MLIADLSVSYIEIGRYLPTYLPKIGNIGRYVPLVLSFTTIGRYNEIVLLYLVLIGRYLKTYTY